MYNYIIIPFTFVLPLHIIPNQGINIIDHNTLSFYYTACNTASACLKFKGSFLCKS